MSRLPRVVIDTNLVLSTLVFANGRLAALRRAWQVRQCVPLVSKITTTELIRVLAYPKFKLDEAARQELLADYLPWCVTVHIPNPPPCPNVAIPAISLSCSLPSRAKPTISSVGIGIY